MTRRRRGLTVAVAAATLALTATASPGATAATGDPNGPVLYGQPFTDYLQPLGSTTKTTVASGYSEFFGAPAAFSPAGDAIAYTRWRCTDCNDPSSAGVTDVFLRSADGTVESLASGLPGDVYDLAWSPTGDRLAVLTVPPDHEPYAAQILSLDVATGLTTVVQDSTTSFEVDPDGLAWERHGERIAFAGNPLAADGSTWVVDYRQLYTVNAVTHARVRVTTPSAHDCHSPCSASEFLQPAWLPDGRLVALEGYDPDIHDLHPSGQEKRGLSVVSPGDHRGTTLVPLGNGAVYSMNNTGPVVSPDGTQVLFTRTVSGQEVGRRVVVATGAVSTMPAPTFLDWQPCPTTGCAAWGDSPDKLASTITLDYRSSLSGIAIRGAVTPARAGQKVTVVLQRGKGGSWTTLVKRVGTLDSTSRYAVSFPTQGAWNCRAVARYPGDAQTNPSRALRYFSC